MPIVNDRNYGQLLTTTVAQRSSTVQNIVYNSLPLTRILRDEGRIRVKRGGGAELRIPVQFDKLDAQWFTGYDIVQITPKKLINSARFDWSRLVSMFSLNGTELLFNSGPEEVLDLMETYIDTAEQSARESFEVGLVGTGSLNGGRQMVGMGAAIPTVPNTGIYGGINRANVSRWRTSFYDIANGDVPGFTAWDSTSVRGIINWIALARSRNGRYPDLWIVDANSWAAIDAAVVANQRVNTAPGGVSLSTRLAAYGFTGYTFMTPAGPVDIMPAGGIGNVMPADTAFGIDTKGLAIWEFPNQSFVPFHPGNGMRPINQDAVAQGIVWTGQLVLENPQYTVRVDTSDS